jgi:translation initiation factor 2 beta subunit (eIF-2beta)/eIF-5
MSQMNMDGSDADAFYRYKMRPLELAKKDRQRILSNLNEISVQIGRRPELLVSYFDFEVLRPHGVTGCHINPKGDAVAPEGVEQATLQKGLLDFIQKYVMCPVCKKPETQIDSFQGRSIVLNCIACGTIAPSSHQTGVDFLRWMQSHPQHLKPNVKSLGADSLSRKPDPFRPVGEIDPDNPEKWDFGPCRSDSAGSSGGWAMSPKTPVGDDTPSSEETSAREARIASELRRDM